MLHLWDGPDMAFSVLLLVIGFAWLGLSLPVAIFVGRALRRRQEARERLVMPAASTAERPSAAEAALGGRLAVTTMSRGALAEKSPPDSFVG